MNSDYSADSFPTQTPSIKAPLAQRQSVQSQSVQSQSVQSQSVQSQSVQSQSTQAERYEPGRSRLNRQPTWVRYGFAGTFGLLVVMGTATGLQSLTAPPLDASPAESRVLPVETIAVEAVSSYPVSRIYTGEIAALRSSDLGFENGGTLIDVMVDEGQRVAAGEPLAQLDVRNLETQRLQIEAQRAQAQARLTELENGARPEDIAVAEAAVRDLEQQLTLQKTQQQRREHLYSRGAIAREQLDEFTFGANSLQAQLDQAHSRLESLLNGTRIEQVDAQRAAVNQLQAQLKDLDVIYAKSTITAPFDAIVAHRSVDEGTVVGAGQTVLHLVENAAPEARIGVPAAVVDQLELGSTQTVRVNSQSYSATLDAILPRVNAATRTQSIVLKLDPAALGQIEPGQTARLTVEEMIEADGYWLPVDALTQGIRGLWTCYVLVPKGADGSDGEVRSPDSANDFVAMPETPSSAANSMAENSTVANSTTTSAGNNTFVIEQRSVEIIQRESVGENTSTGTRVLVRGTLQPGEKVVASGVHRLVPGQQVREVAFN